MHVSHTKSRTHQSQPSQLALQCSMSTSSQEPSQPSDHHQQGVRWSEGGDGGCGPLIWWGYWWWQWWWRRHWSWSWATISMGIWERLYVPVSSNESLFIHVKKGNRILVPWGWLILLPLPSGNYIYYRVRFIFYRRKFRSSDSPLFANETAIVGPFLMRDWHGIIKILRPGLLSS